MMGCMSQQAVSVEVRLALGAHAVLEEASGASVTEVCQKLGISRDTYYRYQRRMRQEGVEGLVPRSRRPRTSPSATPAHVVAAVVDKHDDLVEEGWDGGAQSVHDWLTLEGAPVPSARTCHKILTDHGRTISSPAKRPKSSYRRFEAMKPNGVWQLDGHEIKLADDMKAVVLRFQDDHSRMLLASRAASGETGQETWKCLVAAMDRHGKPAFVQCDNSRAFTARFTKGGGYAIFESRLFRIGVGMINSSRKHPQTNGKKEREWQTLDQWLSAREPAQDLQQLQRLLDAYDLIFNTERPHQGIGGVPPARRYTATDKAVPDPAALSQRQFLRKITLSAAGYFDLPGARISFGSAWAGATLQYLVDQDHAVIFHKEHLLAHIRLDPTKMETPTTKRAYHRVETRP